MTPRVAFVIDTSGSMRGAPAAAATAELGAILGLFPDDGLARAWSFADTPSELTTGWLKLPDAIGVDELLRRTRELGEGTGNTNVGLAVASVLSQCPEDDLSVVVVTDGSPTGPTGVHLAMIATAQMARVRPATIHVIVIMDNPDSPSSKAERQFAQDLAAPHGAVVSLERCVLR